MSKSDPELTSAERSLHDDIVHLVTDRSSTDHDAVSQLVLASIRILAQHMEPHLACEAFLVLVRETVANMRH